MALRSVRFGVRSRKLSNVGQSLNAKNVLSRAPPCFGRHVEPLDPAAFAVVSTRTGPAWWVIARSPYVCNP
jgi:hypothetical protein